MSNLFKSSKKETSSTQIDPAVYQNVLQNIEMANQLAALPFTPYQGLLTAPFTQDYMRGEAMTRAIAQQGGYVPELELASQQLQRDLGFQPERVQGGQVQTQFEAPLSQAERVAPGTTVERVMAGQVGTQFAPERVSAQQIASQFGAAPIASQFTAPNVSVGAAAGPAGVRDINAQQIASQFAPQNVQGERLGTQFSARDVAGPGAAPSVQGASFLGRDLAAYQNPYQQQVIEAGLSDIDRSEAARRQQIGAQATAARAFGGSRQAVQEGIAAGEAARERNRFIAEQRAQGFQQAAQLREADVGREQQASLANQQAAQNVMQLAQAGQISNQERDLRLQQLGLTAGQTNVETAMRAQLANQAAGQQAQQMGLTAQQANQQAALEAARANQAAQLQTQQLGTQTGQFNVEQQMRAALANQAAQQQAQQLGLTASQSNQQAALEAQRLGLTAGQANQEAALRAALANQQAGQTGQQMGLQAGQFNVQAAIDAARLNQAAGLQAQGMTQAQQQFNAQQANQMALANQQARQRAQEMGMTAQQFNAQQAMQAALANQGAGQQAAQFRMGAAGQLGQFGQQALQNRYGAAQAQLGLGQGQQGLMQQYLDRQYQEFMRQQNYPLQQLAIRQGAIAASPINQSTTGKVTSTPSYFNMAQQVFGSDMDMKKNAKKIKNPLDKVNRLKGIEFEWEDGYGSEEGEDEGGEKDMSVSAQDVEKVMPEAVSRRRDGMRQVGVPQVIGLLTEAVKELDKKVSKKGKR